jgi:hypothetical protein
MSSIGFVPAGPLFQRSAFECRLIAALEKTRRPMAQASSSPWRAIVAPLLWLRDRRAPVLPREERGAPNGSRGKWMTWWAGSVGFFALRCYLQDTERKFQKSPLKFLEHKVWKNYRFNPNAPYAGVRGKRNVAI